MKFFRSIIYWEFIKTASIPLVVVGLFLLILHQSTESSVHWAFDIAAMCIFYFGLLAYLITQSKKMSAKLCSPIEQLTDVTTKMMEETEGVEIAPVGIEEVDRLLKNFNTMSESVRNMVTRRDVLLTKIIKSKERFRTLLKSAKAIPWEADTTLAKVRFIGSQAGELFGYPVEDWHRENFWKERIHPEDLDKISLLLDDQVSKNEDFDLEYRMMTSNNRVIWVLHTVTFEPERSTEGRLRGFLFDITDRKGTMQDLREKERLLQQAQKMEAVGRQASGVAHDFNNILSIIKGYTSPAMLESLVEGSPVFQYMEDINKAADHASLLTRQLLALRKKETVKPRNVNLNRVISGLSNMLEGVAGKEVEMKMTLDPVLGAVEVDPSQIEQVVINLAKNAKDAMPDGGTLSLTTSNVVFEDNDCHEHLKPGLYVLLMVTDTGCGMNEETLARVFEPFFTTKEIGKGTGLGLATVLEIVKECGGHVDVESQAGKGTTFWVFLPQIDDNNRRSVPADMISEEDPLQASAVVPAAAEQGSGSSDQKRTA